MTSHLVEILAALALTAALPATAMARVFPPHSDCTTYSGNARISCNKQMGNMQRSGAKTPEPGATQPGATSTPSGSTAGSASSTGSSTTGNAASSAQQTPAQTGNQGGTQSGATH